MTLNELIKKAKEMSGRLSSGDVPMIHENGKPFDVELSYAIGDDGSIKHITVREKL